MPKLCQKCGRRPLRGNSRSHSNIATKRWQNVNLQKKTVDGKKFVMCTRCIRTLSKVTAK